MARTLANGFEICATVYAAGSEISLMHGHDPKLYISGSTKLHNAHERNLTYFLMIILPLKYALQDASSFSIC